MSDYRREQYRFVNLGIDVHVAVDKVPQGKFLLLKNVRISQEGHLTSREGIEELVNLGVSTALFTLKRLDGSTILTLSGATLYRNATAYAAPSNAYTTPVSIVTFKPKLGSAIWGFIASANQMRKVKADGTEQKWGISTATTAATATNGGAGNLNSNALGAIGYDWRYTYYSDTTGAESNPSAIQSSLLTGTNFDADVTVVASADAQVTDIRLYRRGGTLPDNWRYVGDFPNTAGPHTDNVADSVLALNEFLVTTNDVPFTTVSTAGATVTEHPLPYAWGPFLGKYIMACGDSHRPGYVYWTNPGNPDGADPANSLSVTPPTEPLIGGFIYNGGVFCYSRVAIYELLFGSPNSIPTFVGRKSPVGRGVASPGAVAVGDWVYFLSDDGIYRTDCTSPAESITDDSMRPIFRQPIGEEASQLYKLIDYNHTNHQLVWAGHELWFSFKDIDSGGVSADQTWIYDPLGQRWRTFDSSLRGTGRVALAADDTQPYARVLIAMPTSGNNKIYSNVHSGLFTNIDGGTAPVPVTIQTGFLDQGLPTIVKQYGNIVIDAVLPGSGSANNATLDVLVDGRTGLESSVQTTTLTGTGVRKLYSVPLQVSGADIHARNICFKLTWSQDSATRLATFYGFDLLWRPDAEPLEHWEFQPTTHGLSGWQFARDLYLVIKSTAAATLTITIDGTAHTYNVPSTAGVKSKVYIGLDPAKGKTFLYELNTNSAGTPFYLYGDDCEIRIKQWNTSLDYRLLTPFAQPTLTTGGQTNIGQ